MKASTCIYIIDNLWRALLILAIRKKKLHILIPVDYQWRLWQPFQERWNQHYSSATIAEKYG